MISYTCSNKLARIRLLPSIADINYTDDTDKCNFCIDEKYLILSDDIKNNKALNEKIKLYNSQAEALITELNLKIVTFVGNKISTKWDIMEPPEPLRYQTKFLSNISQRVRFYNEKHYGKL